MRLLRTGENLFSRIREINLHFHPAILGALSPKCQQGGTRP